MQKGSRALSHLGKRGKWQWEHCGAYISLSSPNGSHGEVGCNSLLRFFEDLEKRHQEHLLIPDISDIVEEHASNHFSPYISYCSNEVYQQRTLQRLL